MTPKRTAALAALCAAGLAAAAFTLPAHGGAAAQSDQGVVVQGTGSVTAVPDRGAFSFTVSTPGKTASAALQANSTGAAAVVAALKRAGIAAADLQTSQVSLDQRSSQDGQTIAGYVATTTVTAQLRDLAKAGAVVDAAVAAGADGFSGPSLSVADSARLYDQALKAAVADAKAKAAALAAAAGLQLGRITSVQESGAQPVPLAAAAGKADSVVVEPGTQEVQATVTVSFAAG